MRALLTRSFVRYLVAVLLLSAACGRSFASDRKDVVANDGSWQAPFEGSASSPVLVNGVLYAGTQDGAVCALDPATGHVLWRYQTGAGLASGSDFITLPPGAGIAEGMAAARARQELGKREVAATPVVEDSTVLVGSRDHSFYALDAVTGQARWSYPTKGEIYDRAIASEGRVYFSSGDGFLYALELATGHLLWSFETLKGIRMEKRPPSEPVWKDGTLYITTWTEKNSYLYAIDATSGTAKWTLEVDASDPSPPALSDSLVLFSTYVTQGEPLSKSAVELAVMFAVDASSGSLRWKSSGMRTEYSSHTPAVVVHGVGLLGADHGMCALDVATGATLWTSTKWAVAEVRGSDPGADDDPLVYVTTVKGSAAFVGEMVPGTLRALDLKTGVEKWSFKPREGLAHVASIQGNTIVLQAGRSLHCVARETGKEVWSFHMKTWSNARALVVGDRVFVPAAAAPDGSEHGVFYATRVSGLEPPH